MKRHFIVFTSVLLGQPLKAWSAANCADLMKLRLSETTVMAAEELTGGNPFPIASAHFQYWIRQDPAFDWRTLSEARFETDFRESQRKFNQVIGTDEVNLERSVSAVAR